MNFGEALQQLKGGNVVRRSGWNGKGMFLAFQPGYPDGVPCNANTARALGIAEGTVVRVLPYITMSTVDGALVPWLASQTDVLAEDWEASYPDRSTPWFHALGQEPCSAPVPS